MVIPSVYTGRMPRSIIVKGVSWSYHYIKCRGPRTFVVPITMVTGGTPDSLERGRWKKTREGMVTPREIARFLMSSQWEML